MSRNSRRRELSRRDWTRLSVAGTFGLSVSKWLPALATAAAKAPQRRRACILLWMTGGPSQLDTFDPKPGHENGGPFQAIDTSVPGIRISEHLPRVAQLMQHVAPIRSMSTKEGDHGRATHLLRTGYAPQGPIQYPTLGSLVSKELASDAAELPDYVSVAPFRFFSPSAYGPGFLGAKFGPLIVGGQVAARGSGFGRDDLRVQHLQPPSGIDVQRADSRLALLNDLEEDFAATHPSVPGNSRRAAYQRAVRMMRSSAVQAFNLEEEPNKLRDAYGRHLFGQGCLLARRLVERGVPFVEVSLNGVGGGNALGWDTHQNNFDTVKQLSAILDSGWATLMSDLHDRGMLDSTLIVWMGEFGRTPKINPNGGRDHFPAAWSAVLAGGGIRGGQVIGKTNPAGMAVIERPVSHADLIATICLALGLDPTQQNISNVGRPIRLADPAAQPIRRLLA